MKYKDSTDRNSILSQKCARLLSTLFPNLSTSIFFLVKKVSEYDSEFIKHVEETNLDSNFYLGPEHGTNS